MLRYVHVKYGTVRYGVASLHRSTRQYAAIYRMMLRTYYASSQDAKQRAVARGTATQRTEVGERTSRVSHVCKNGPEPYHVTDGPW